MCGKGIDLLDPKSDYIFKLIFADEQNKDVLISLLNAVLKDKPHVYDVTLLSPEMPRLGEDKHWIFLDMKAKIGDDEYVDIEMQAHNGPDIIDRGVQYLSRMLVNEAKRSDSDVSENEKKRWNYKTPKAIGIWILGERLSIDLGPEPVHEIVMAPKPHSDNQPFITATDKMRLFTVELPKFRPEEHKYKNDLERWMAFFKNPMDPEILKDHNIRIAWERLQYLSADEKVRAEYDARNDAILDELSRLNSAIEEGEARGIAKGIAKGIAEGIAEGERIGIEKAEAKAYQEKIESAKSLLRANIPVEVISDSFGLSIEEIKQLL